MRDSKINLLKYLGRISAPSLIKDGFEQSVLAHWKIETEVMYSNIKWTKNIILKSRKNGKD